MSAEDGIQKDNTSSTNSPEQKLNASKPESAQKSSAEKTATDRQSPSLTPVQNIGNHRMHRSSVRPFFCCGSQLSLNSITEFIDVSAHNSEKEESELTDLSDCDEVTGLIDNLNLDSCGGKHETRDGTDKIYRRQSRRKKNESLQDKNTVRKKFWTLKLRGKLHVPKRSRFNQDEEESPSQDSCVCTSYRKTSQSTQSSNSLRNSAISFEATSASMAEGISCEAGPSGRRTHGKSKSKSGHGNSAGTSSEVFVTLHPINFDELYPTEDIDERRIAERAKEMEEGIDVPDIWIPQNVHLSGARGGGTPDVSSDEDDFDTSFIATFGAVGPSSSRPSSVVAPEIEESCYGECSFPIMAHKMMGHPFMPARSHSQVDYIHCLVPDILEITNCSYYWGVMDRYQAELLLDKKPEGTFLLRDSAQDEYLFSVSFRRYGRSLHARIEQWNHKFSFDSHDPGVFASDSVCGLIEHYKDPSCCMFFEPMLTSPLHRNFPFSLQHLCRSAICNYITYDGINLLPLPSTLREYMKYYHYKQKVRMRRFDTA